MSELFNDLYIFEMANNHQGDVKHGLAIIDAMAKIARKRGVTGAVKFQYRDLDTFIHPDFKDRDDVKHIPRFMSTRLKEEEFRTMLDAVRDRNLVTVVTPFDEASVKKCVEHGVQIIKVASCSVQDWPLLEAIAETGKPVIVSTGGASIYDIDNVVSFFKHKDIDFAMLHCVGIYPTPPEKLHLNFIDKMVRRYPYVTIGYSGHESPDNTDVVKVAVAKGAKILERHVGVPTDKITLNKYSMNPEQTDAWIEASLTVKEINGLKEKKVDESEMNSLMSLKRGVFAKGTIKEGQQITRDQVFFAMPCSEGQLTSGEFGQYRGTFYASKSYEANAPIFEHRQPDSISIVRGILHDAKGMIYEANIDLGSDFQIELSHHYGIERFRETGAILINVINREYCKKLIVMLPGQQHPSHQHKVKEETFQVLWGDMNVSVGGEESALKSGDKMLVERGVWHSFSSKNGCIFEEISTTHVRNDSFYEDESISKLDPMERKTILDSW